MTNQSDAPAGAGRATHEPSPDGLGHSVGIPSAVNLPVNYNTLEPQERRAVRQEYARLQNGLCHHCKSPLDKQPPESITRKPINWKRFPPNFLRWPHHLHHSHDTGMTIGTVHAYCNAVLWQYHGE